MNQTHTESVNIFLIIKTAITGVGSGFTIAFGWLGWLVIAWIACMALDWITGCIAACKGGKWASSIARDGIVHKAGMIVVVVIAAIADGVLSTVLANLPNIPIPYTTALLPVVVVWYIFTELGSITENATKMGAPVPAVLTKLLATASEITNTEK